MTRLASSDIATVVEWLDALDRSLVDATGATLTEIAQYAVGEAVDFHHVKNSVVPITAGQGIIGGFSQTVAGILRHMGVDAFVTSRTDVGGLYEGRMNSSCQFAADDDTFFAVNLENNQVSENGYATGLGFAAALDLAAKGVENKPVLVAGAGPVGLTAADYFASKGAIVTLYDIDASKLEDRPYETTTSIAGRKFSLVLEATTAENVITKDVLTPNAIVSAPGVPLGVEAKLAQELTDSNRLIHNPLELGTAVMMADVLRKQSVYVRISMGATVVEPCMI